MYVSRPRSTRGRRTQAEHRDPRAALIESAAKAFSRYGYGNVILEQVARDAGYTRGALYHLFKGKEDLALAVVDVGGRKVGIRGMAARARIHIAPGC